MVAVGMVALVIVAAMPSFVHCFQSQIVGDGTHCDITQRAVLRKTAEVCRDIAVAAGRDFTLNFDSLSVSKVLTACSSPPSSGAPQSSVSLQNAINAICFSNTDVDSLFQNEGQYHFHNENFLEGRNLITVGVFFVKSKLDNLDQRRRTLGEVFHILQDFYSHSNWVELGKNNPHSILIRPAQNLENLAGINTPTCRNCRGSDCSDNILPNILQQGLLTSGYSSILSPDKPAGKCSHGGESDVTRKTEPVGGINKDTVDSDHGSLHKKAAELAVDASVELLEDIRRAVGETTFLRLMGISQGPVLCFVIDTTGSMRDDIAEAKRVSFAIIDQRRGTPQEPSAYILVPFNDPDFGPVTRTKDADIFKGHINSLTARGGGDAPEMSLSGLRLALTSAPPSSQIFVFTDASAKDVNLKSTVISLIESTKSQVTFMLTDVLSSRRRRSNQGGLSRAISQLNALLYRELAQLSGGQSIEVSKLDLPLATAVIEDSLATAVVTVFQAVRNPGSPDNFTVTLDASLSNVVIFITGVSSLAFRLTSPTGVSQSSRQPSGPLGNFTTVGNLRRISLHAINQTGSWEISINSKSPYTVKVTGRSSVDFVYNFVEAHKGSHAGFTLKGGRLTRGGNATLLVTVTGSDTLQITEVTLRNISGTGQMTGSLQVLGNNNYLVRFSGIPSGDFVVQLMGRDNSTTSRSTPQSTFQRQASTHIQTSRISVTTQVGSTNIEPGSNISIPFTVSSDETGTFTVQASNDRTFYTSPSSVAIAVGSGGNASGTVNMNVPASAVSGSDVTLTIEVQNSAGTDLNYAVLRFSVAAKVTDLSGPLCQVVNISGICPTSSLLCASSQWGFIANLTDGINGTGIERVTALQGNGTLNATVVVGAGGDNVTIVTYSTTCCVQKVDLAAVDRLGNVDTCTVQARVIPTTDPPTTPDPPTTSSPSTPPDVTTTPVNTAAVPITSTRGRAWILWQCLWIHVVLFSLVCRSLD